MPHAPGRLGRTPRLFAAALLLALAGCGGGVDDGGGAAAPLPVSAEAQVGPAGAALSLQDLTLTVPPRALDVAVAISLRRSAAAPGETARFAVAPAGRALAAATALRFERAGLPARAAFFWEVEGELWLLPTRRAGDVLTASVTSIGFTRPGVAAAHGRDRALTAAPGSGGANLVVQPVDCQAHVTQLSARLRQASVIGDMTLAVAIADDLEATQDACANRDRVLLEQSSCQALQGAVNQAQTFLAKDFTEFQSLVAPLYGALSFVQLTGATCTPAIEAVEALAEAKFDQFRAVLQSQQLRGDFAQEAGARELRVLLDYRARCQALGLSAPCERLADTLLPNLLDGMRQAAFDECRSSGSGLAVSQFHALGSLANNTSQFLDFARYGSRVLEADLSYCTNPSLDLHVFNTDNGFPEEMPTRAQTLRPLQGLGRYAIDTDIEVPRNGSLTVGGRVSALRCADGSASQAELVARIGGVEVGRRGVHGDTYTLNTSPLDLVLARVLPAVGLDAEKATGFTLEVFREGGQCLEPAGSAFTAPFKMFEIRVSIPAPAPVQLALRGTVTAKILRTDLNDLFEPVQPRRTVTNLTIAADLEEQAGRVLPLSFTVTGDIVETRASLRSFDLDAGDGKRCTYEHRFDREDARTFIAGSGRSLSLDVRLAGAVVTMDELTLRGPTRVVSKVKARLQNQAGDCSRFDISAPPDSETTDEIPISLNLTLSLTQNPAYRGTVSTDALGRRSVLLSGSLSENLPRGSNGLTRAQNSSAALSMADVPR